MHVKIMFELPRITLNGKVEPKMVDELDRQIKELLSGSGKDKETKEPPNKAVLWLSTTGGTVADGRAIYERLRLLQQIIDLSLIGIGAVYSSGVTIMMAFPKEKRFITKETKVMFHQMQRHDEKKFDGAIHGVKIQLDEYTESVNRGFEEMDWLFRMIAKDTGKKKKRIDELALKSHQLTGSAAVKFGLVGALIKEK